MKELEYIIALHQTSNETRSNATVSSVDIVALLGSRYSLTISHEEAIEVVRSLSGGDRRIMYEDMTRSSTSSKDSSSIWHKATQSIASRFRFRRASEEGNNIDCAENHSLPRAEQPFPTGQQRRHSPATASKTSAMMKRLGRLHARSHLGKNGHHSMVVLQDQVAADLRAKVVEKTKSTKELGKKIDEADDPIQSQSIEINVVDSSEQSREVSTVASAALSPPEEHEKPSGDIRRQQQSVWFDSAPEEDEEPCGNMEINNNSSQVPDVLDDYLKMDENDQELLPEYLDLVQLLSTILIPKFARISYEINEEYEEPSTTTVETDLPEQPSLWSRLGHRFVSYGRRKLQIQDQSVKSYSAEQVVEMGRQALLQTIPGDEDPVLDGTLVQLLQLVNGEVERANNEQLVREMVQVAQSPTGLFDQESLIRAISSDLACWNPTNQDTPTSFFYDVCGVPLPSVKTHLKDNGDQSVADEEGGAQSSTKNLGMESSADSTVNDLETDSFEKLSLCSKCCRFFFPVIHALRYEKSDFSTAFLGVDMVVDTSVSLAVHVLIWVSYILV